MSPKNEFMKIPILSFLICIIPKFISIVRLEYPKTKSQNPKKKPRKPLTLPIAEIIWVKNVRAIVVCGFLLKLKKYILKIKKKSWEPFGSYLLNSTANPAHFHSNWAGLAVLFSR